MVSEYIEMQKEKRKRDNGTKEKGLVGYVEIYILWKLFSILFSI